MPRTQTPQTRVVLPSAARTTIQNVIFPSDGARGLVVVMDLTAGTTPALTVNIRGVDAASGKKWLLLASAVLAAVATTTLKVGPGLTAVANAAANDLIPPQIEIEVAVGNANSITYSVGAHFTN